MAGSINKVILIGNLGQDPEIKTLPSGSTLASFSIATSESWKDKQTGEKKEQTEWHRCSVFGRLAEVVRDYVPKGTKVYVEGSLHTRKWQDQNGENRYSTEVKVRDLTILSSKQDNQGGGQPSKPKQGFPSHGGKGGGAPDDLPF